MTYKNSALQQKPATPDYEAKAPAEKIIVGVDVFLHKHQLSASMLAERLKLLETAELELEMITNRGVKVWPDGFAETFCTDQWRCRFMLKAGLTQLGYGDIIRLLSLISANNLDVIKTENLCTFHGEPGFMLGQGL